MKIFWSSTWNGFALIDVHALAGVHVLEESGIARQVVRTLLTRMAPRLADGGTAELLGADDPLQLSCAHLILDAPKV